MKRQVNVSKQVHPAKRLTNAFSVLLILTALLHLSAQPSLANGNDAIVQKYRELIPRLMAEQNLPGLAIAVVDERGVVWSEGFGFADYDHRTPITPDTIFSVQSTSKTFTATAVMLAVQDGLLDLDVPITTYLPDFTVHSIFEEHPERKITLRMLLSHTAGFTHEAPLGNNFDLEPVSFEEHVRTISDTWLRFPVGTGYAYSNLGISLAGYILQTVSGQSFASYVEEKLLHPLGMVNSSFDMDQIRINPNRAIGHSEPLPRVPLEIPIVPEGGLYASANDMAKFIQFQLNRGSVNGESVLNPVLLDEMYTVPAPAQGSREGYGLGVARTGWYKGRNAVLFSHGGGGFGFLSDLWWLPELKIGITVLTNATTHNLQGALALQILYDFVSDPGSIYYTRMMALPDRQPVAEGDGHYRPPVGLAQAISKLGMQPSDQDQLRWKKYEGVYSARVWGVLDPSRNAGRVYIQDSHLYLKTTESGDTLRLVETSPGLFFAGNGEVLDFRGAVPTWRNIKLTKVGAGPAPGQQALLAVCALVFLSGLLFFPLRSLVRRIRRTGTPARSTGRWATLASTLAILTSLFGLSSISLIVAMPTIIYSGFLGWLHLPLWQRLLMHMPFALLIAGIGLLAMNVPAWKNRWWSRGERIYLLAASFTSVAMLLLLNHWHLIGLSL
jgi:CubicO group peptidase (beta-lactamase class C family)